MKGSFLFAFVFSLCILLTGCGNTNDQIGASASWAYPFVKWDGKTYVITENKINKDKIGEIIGEVTKYSSREGTYSGNFSNALKKGTKYFKIKETNTNKAIAVEKKKGKYIRALISDKWEKKHLE
ncbi:hypothetical protein [Virgibacillus necropolis]|uniref:Uncharacterized protein n=1 Tax=Virgibacillus necropolis TaxID=163877 RepID=A0A221MCP1_9BACI|nr:hypothetical protein [Virgibacillus necropolis]ASN05382.1 hypothetical protein CFK40_10340 [Virgibacillus necropolis]